jgi:hypothetical protein
VASREAGRGRGEAGREASKRRMEDVRGTRAKGKARESRRSFARFVMTKICFLSWICDQRSLRTLVISLGVPSYLRGLPKAPTQTRILEHAGHFGQPQPSLHPRRRSRPIAMASLLPLTAHDVASELGNPVPARSPVRFRRRATVRGEKDSRLTATVDTSHTQQTTSLAVCSRSSLHEARSR